MRFRFCTTNPPVEDWSLINNPVYACASFSARTVTVAARSKATIQVTIKPPTKLDPSLLPTYSGFVVVSDNEMQYVIPYQGVPYARRDVTTLDTSNILNLTTKPLPPAGGA